MQGRILSTFLFSILFCFICTTVVSGQKFVTDIPVSANFVKTPLSDVFVTLAKVSGVNISFNPSLISQEDFVTLNVKEETLGDVLDILLETRYLEYKVNGKQIIIVAREAIIREFSSELVDIKGFIEDNSTGERLPFAYIFTSDRQYFTTSNEYGFFNLQLPIDFDSITVSYLGYKDSKVSVADLQEGKVVLQLDSNTDLEEVVIVEQQHRPEVEEYDIFVDANIAKLKKSEAFLGEFDILRYVQSLPGTSTGADGLGGTSVRGANADNNLILLDGVPVYNSGHALGIFSIFNQEAIKSAKFYRSHIPAQYGGRLASVLDIRTKEGSLTSYGGSVSVGVINAKFFLEGPIWKDRISFAVSGRRTLLEPYLAPISGILKRSEGNDGQTNYSFGDFNLKLQFVVNSKNRLNLSYYSGFDSFVDSTTTLVTGVDTTTSSLSLYDWAWGNSLSSIRWSSQFGDKLFSSVSLYNSSYDFNAFNIQSFVLDTFNVNESSLADASMYSTSINDYGVNWDLDYYLNFKHKIKFGALFVYNQFEPGLLAQNFVENTLAASSIKSEITEQLDVSERSSRQFDLYVTDHIQLKSVFFDVGLRASVIQTGSTEYYNLQPRLSAKFQVSKGVYMKLSGNYTSQYLHLLASSGIGLPTDIWIPSTNAIKPQTALQFSGGFDFILRKGLALTVELYHKNLDNILNLKEGAVFSIIEDEDWENDIPVGTGRSYGLEAGLRGQLSSHYFNLNYTYGRSTRQFDDINSGEVFFSRFDRRHQGKFLYQFQLNKNIVFNANWTLLTGHPVTLPTRIFENELIFTEKNNQRLPTYDRLDLSVNISNDFSWGSQTIVLGVSNVYNKRNPYFLFVDGNQSDVNSIKVKQISVFPILPNVSYTVNF